jgi:tryptophan-rich sensory protein
VTADSNVKLHSQSTSRTVLFAVSALALVAAASALGQFATSRNLAPWYAELAKPAFNPPNAVFGPVWITLYLLMAFSLWRVLRLPARTEGRAGAIVLFLAQLALNLLWSFLFFGAHSPILGLVDIIPQLLLIAATIFAFWPLDRMAAVCLIPLVAWVGFATILNFEIWRLNG